MLRRVYAAPEYNWDLPNDPLRLFREWYRAALEWLEALEQAHPVAYFAVLGAMTGLLVAIAVHLAYLMWRALRPRARIAATPAGGRLRPQDAAWYLREARRMADQGRYAEALAHRFTALALELDRRKAVRFHPSKTPAEYVGEARVGPAARQALMDLVLALYDHLFGGISAGADDVRRFDQRASEIATHHAAG